MFGNQYNTPLAQAQGQGNPGWHVITVINPGPVSFKNHSVIFRNGLRGYCVSERIDERGAVLVGVQLEPSRQIVTVSRALLDQAGSTAPLTGTHVTFRDNLTGYCSRDKNGACSIELSTQYSEPVVTAHRALFARYRYGG